MGIFSLFGKKDRQAAAPSDTARAKRSSSSRSGATRSASRLPAAKRDVQAARDTALKIDAIESEMSSEFVTTSNTAASTASTAAGTAAVFPARPAAAGNARQERPESRLPELGNTTQMLLEGQHSVTAIAAPSSDAGAVIEEAAIMHANGQPSLAEQMLSNAIEEDSLGEHASRAWLMLFDLYQLGGKQAAFEQLAIAYANKFETSPPTWADNGARSDEPAAGATPAVPFSGRLDAGCGKLIERIQKLSESHRTLRLEFIRVESVDADGCGQLLAVLKKLQKSGHELVLVGAAELAQKIRAGLEVGRREDEDAWLLLLELLCLLNMEHAFEEAGIDYCVTFEVSPPPFVAPQNSIITAGFDTAAPSPAAESGFLLPRVIEGRVDDLVVALAAYSDEHMPALVDCSQLTRIDFNAAGRLLTGLAPFCGSGKVLEFHHVSHLVAELFKVIGLQDLVRIYPRKN